MIEKRMAAFEIREDAAATGRLVGRAAVFDRETEIAGLFREVIRPGAFTKTLQERDVKMLWQHDSTYPMGSTKRGTLTLTQTPQALEVDNDPPTEPPYSGFRQNIERGDVSQMSFGFEVVKEKRTEEEGKLPLREILEVKLYEVSPVTFPAYSDTEIEARARQVVAAWATREDASTVEASTDEAAAMRTTQEPGTSVSHSVEPDGLTPDYVLNRCELVAAEEELLSDENSGIAREARQGAG